MLCLFFDAWGVIYQHVISQKTKINAVCYVQVLKSLQKHINKKKLEIALSWILHQDSARPHVTSIVRDFLLKHEIPTVAHPPYSLIRTLNCQREKIFEFWNYEIKKEKCQNYTELV